MPARNQVSSVSGSSPVMPAIFPIVKVIFRSPVWISRQPERRPEKCDGRSSRDRLFGFPDKHHAQMAAERRCDPHQLYEVLSAHLRQDCEKSIARIGEETTREIRKYSKSDGLISDLASLADFDGEPDLIEAWRAGLAPDPDLTVWEWSDENVMLSSIGAAELLPVLWTRS